MPIGPRPLGHAYGAGRQPSRQISDGMAALAKLPSSHGGGSAPIPVIKPVSAPQDYRTTPPFVITAPPQAQVFTRRGLPTLQQRGLSMPRQNLPVDQSMPGWWNT